MAKTGYLEDDMSCKGVAVSIGLRSGLQASRNAILPPSRLHANNRPVTNAITQSRQVARLIRFARIAESAAIARQSGLTAVAQIGDPVVADRHLGKARDTSLTRRRLRREADRQRARAPRKGEQAQELPKFCILGEMHREDIPITVNT